MYEQLEIPKSRATKSLAKVSDGLVVANQLVLKARPPVAELLVIVSKIDGYIADALSVMGFADNVLDLLHEALQIAKYLGELIPEVGPVIAQGATFIENLRIEQTIRTILGDMRAIVKRGQDTLVKSIKDGANFVSASLEKVLEQLPPWGDTVKMMTKVFAVVDLVVFVLFKDERDELVAKVMQALSSMSGGSLQQIELVKNALQPILTFVEGVWRQFKEAVIKPLEAAFASIMENYRPVMAIIRQCIDICGTIKRWFEPFFWVLNAIQWIFERTVGWLIRKVMDELHLTQFVEDWKNKIEDALGIKAMKNKLEDMMNNIMGPISQPLKDIMALTGPQSVENTVKEFAQNLQAWRKDPMGALFDLVGKAISDDPWDPEKPDPIDPIYNDSVDKHHVPSIGSPTLRTADPGADEIKRIGELQLALDDFVANVGSRGSIHPSQDYDTENAAGSNAAFPKLRYALHDGEPVSVLMRVTHKRVLDRQKAARNSKLPEMRQARSHSLSIWNPGAHPDVYSESLETPNIAAFLVKHAALVEEAEAAVSYIDKMKNAAKQADNDFDTYLPEAVGFCDHFASTVEGFDPILDAVAGLLNLPLKYRKVLTEDLVKIIKEAGLPDAVANALPLLFAAVDKTVVLFESFKGPKSVLQDKAKQTSGAYRVFQSHVAHACSPERFPKTLGTGVRDLTSLIMSLKRYIEGSVTCFTFVKDLALTVVKNQGQLGSGAEAAVTRLDSLYGSLNTAVDSITKNLHALPQKVDRLFETLVVVHSDVQLFFKAADTISQHCRAVELKLIAADRIRELCNRINSAIGPFESLLLRFGIKPEEPGDKPPPTPADVLKKMGKNAGTLLGFISSLSEKGVFQRIIAVLKFYFDLKEISKELDELRGSLERPLADHLKLFDDAMWDLIELVKPKQTNMYTVPSGPAAADTLAEEPVVFACLTPLMDETDSKSLGELLREITELAGGIEYPDETEPIPRNAIRVPKWARPGVDEGPVKSLALITWCRVWDEAQPAYPSGVFVGWHVLLQGLVRIITTRTSWQRLNRSIPPPDPPSYLSDREGVLWRLLEEKATIGGPQYQANIMRPFTEPLHDRINRLLTGVVQLPEGSPDIFKLLPPPAEITDIPPIWTLPQPAVDLVLNSFEGNTLPSGLLLALQRHETFEEAATDLHPYFVQRGTPLDYRREALDKARVALEELHHDCVLMSARKFLELATNDRERLALRFVDLCGSTQRIDRL